MPHHEHSLFVICLASWEQAISAGPHVCMWMTAPGSGAEASDQEKRRALFPPLPEGEGNTVVWMTSKLCGLSFLWPLSSLIRSEGFAFAQVPSVLSSIHYILFEIKHLPDKALFPRPTVLPRLTGEKINVGWFPKLSVLILYFCFSAALISQSYLYMQVSYQCFQKIQGENRGLTELVLTLCI